MEPPQKRPRLSVFEGQSSNVELATARHENDLQLKNRFEAIFEKYSHDFTDIGDEIDVNTGEIVVDNGHLAGMISEKDSGVSVPGNGTTAISERSILRAMIAANEGKDSYFDMEETDDVLTSIETIAENAALTIDYSLSDDGSEDDLFSPPEPSIPVDVETPTPPALGESPQPDILDSAYTSDGDSMFEVSAEDRCLSPDSLFGRESPQTDGRQNVTSNGASQRSDPNVSVLDENSDENAILAKFGESVGQEVLDLLEKRTGNAEAHIEPAWRIPVKIAPRSHSKSKSISKSISKSHSGTPVFRERPTIASNPSLSPQKGVSLWRAPRQQRRKNTESKEHFWGKIGAARKARVESEDPLQEGFVSDREEEFGNVRELVQHTDDDDDDGDYSDQDVENTIFEDLMSEGICPYCKVQFKNRAGVIVHFGRLERNANAGMRDDKHDIEYIQHRKPVRSASDRGPRLLICDFRTMVELHEGAGLSFDEISEHDVLRTKKTGARLLDLYNRHRSPQDHYVDRPSHDKWTELEDEIMDELCGNPLTTLATLKRRLRRRSETEIGDRLADMWLEELDESGRFKSEQASEADIDEEDENEAGSGEDGEDGPRYPIDPALLQEPDLLEDGETIMLSSGGGSAHWQPYIKAEDSEDDLFGV